MKRAILILMMFQKKIKQELKDIESNELFDFECLNKYLQKLTSEEIKEFIPLMNELLTSSGDINLQEIIAMKNILSYLKNREK